MSRMRNENRRASLAAAAREPARAFAFHCYRNSVAATQRTLIAWLVLVCLPQSGFGDDLIRSPAETKAAFIKYIGDYSIWPAEWSALHDSDEFVIGVVGSDPNGVIDAMERRNQSAKKLLVQKRNPRFVRFGDMGNRAVIRNSLDELEKCSILFFSADSERSWRELQPFIAGKPIMTISELDDFAVPGGMVEFEFNRTKQRIYMLFNMTVLKEVGVVVNARLLDLEISKPIYPGGNNFPGGNK